MPDGDEPGGPGGPQRANLSEGRPGPAPRAETVPEEIWTAGEVFHTRSFWLIAVTTFLAVMASTGIAFNIVPYFQESANLTPTQSVGVLSLSTSMALANLIWGYVSNRVNPKHSIIVVMVFMTGLILFLFTIRSVYAAYIFGALWGIGNGALEVLIYMLLARYFGRGSFGSITGALRPFEAAGLGLGQIFGGLVYDLTGSYHGLFFESIAAYLLAVVFLFLAVQPIRARSTPPEIPASI